MSHAMNSSASNGTGGQCGGLLPMVPTMKDLGNILSEIGNNPAFERGTIKERAYVMRASIACGSMSKGQALIELLQDSLFTLTLNGAYDTIGSFTPWNVLAKQYV